jgi:bis(5'-nucleosyl)-tetraphosphatase (symmetrical)
VADKGWRESTMNRRRIFVGDVQGCLATLEKLLADIEFDPIRDRLYCCGDLVNKGENSAGVIRLVRSIGGETVLGNHDLLLLEIASGRSMVSPVHPLREVLAAPDAAELLGWLEQRPIAIHLGDVFLIHAGVRPTWTDLASLPRRLRNRFDAHWRGGSTPLEDPDVCFALTARFTTTEGQQAFQDWPPPPSPPFHNWADLYTGPEIVVFGHFARQGLLLGDHVRGLDTGCCYGGMLTAWIAEEDRIVQVERVPPRGS